jgi:tetratricopeptide (TPR) repeat protein
MDDLRAEIDRYEAEAETAGLPHYRWWVPLWRGGLAIMAGAWEQAAASAERALALGAEAGDPNAPLLVRVQREVLRETRHEPLDRAFFARMAETSPVPGPYLTSLALIDAAMGRHDRARQVVDQLVADDCALLPANANWLGLCELADLAAEVGHVEGARAAHARLERHADLIAVIGRGLGCYPVTEFFLGRAAAALGRLDEAEARLRRAVDASEASGAHARTPLILLRLGRSCGPAARAAGRGRARRRGRPGGRVRHPRARRAGLPRPARPWRRDAPGSPTALVGLTA